MVENAEWEQIDIRIPQKMIQWKETPILIPTSSGKFRIGIVNDHGAYVEVNNDELSEQLARQMINIMFHKRNLPDRKEN